MKSKSRIRVRYGETDQMGVVYHSNFFLYFEIGRTDYFRDLGFTYKRMEEDSVFMPVTECFCRFLIPAKYDDELEIGTELQMLSRLKLKFFYHVQRVGDSKMIADGYTIHVPTNQEGSPRRIPSLYMEAIRSTGAIKS